jgi:hypothetical protein
MNYKILGAKWWTPPTPGFMDVSGYCIGAVAILSHEPTGSWKVYIGYGLGVDEQNDAQRIAAHGMPIGTKEGACGLFPNLDPDKFVY